MEQQSTRRIVITGGGTGGHVYPALPVIQKLEQENYQIHWIGSKKGIEKDIVQTWGLTYHPVSTGKLRRYFSFQNFTDLFKIAFGFFQSLSVLSKIKPDVLFSKGGFVSVPPVVAASLLKIPVFTHDSDVDPGLATRINSRFARRIFVPYEKSRHYFSSGYQNRLVVSGNPVRKEFFITGNSLSEELMEKIGKRQLIVVIGGSLGAEQLNTLLEEALDALTKDFFIVHQMGGKKFRSSDKENYLPFAYIKEELPGLFQKADLVISRAGAGTLWELAASGTPSLLLPLTNGSRGDQIKNASVFQEAGAAEILPDNTDAHILIERVYGILNDKTRLERMKKAASGFIATPAEDIILEYIHKEGKS